MERTFRTSCCPRRFSRGRGGTGVFPTSSHPAGWANANAVIPAAPVCSPHRVTRAEPHVHVVSVHSAELPRAGLCAACDARGRELLRLVSLKTLSPCVLRDLRSSVRVAGSRPPRSVVRRVAGRARAGPGAPRFSAVLAASHAFALSDSEASEPQGQGPAQGIEES